MTAHPVLIVGGYGVVGTQVARILRAAHPGLPLAIAGRDRARAEALAGTLGRAAAHRADLGRADLGLPADAAFSAVLTLAKDHALNAQHLARRAGIPHIAFSDFAFDIAPAVALAAQHPAGAPVVMLGHFLGGTVMMAALDLARSFSRIEAIEIGAVFDEEDIGGGAAKADLARIAGSVPLPLIRQEGRWAWVSGEAAQRRFRGHDGTEWAGEAAALLDAPSLGAQTGADNVRIDIAVGQPASRREKGILSHEVVIEIRGVLADGRQGAARYDLIDDVGYTTMSARGAALAIERLLGLDGGPPAGPGLHYPETLFDAGQVVARMKAFGTRFTRSG